MDARASAVDTIHTSWSDGDFTLVNDDRVEHRSGADIIVDLLIAAGVRHVFGIVSIHNMPIVDAISTRPGIELITTRHEQGAAHMADGYARATGGLGVALGSTGPGATNMVTGLYEAAYVSSRLLVVVGQAETGFYGKGKGYVHEAENQKAMLESVASAVASPRYVDEIGPALKRVIESIRTGRVQPGAIEVPIDLQYASTETPVPALEALRPIAPDPSRLADAADAIAAAGKRVILAGGGVATHEARDALTALAEQIDAPVITTLNGKGSIDPSHPLHVGPTLLQPAMLERLAEADLLIAVGTRFQAGAGGMKVKIDLPPMVHIDVDPRMIDLSFRARVGVVGDAELALRGLLAAGLAAGDAQYRETLQTTAAEIRAHVRERIGPDHARVLDSFAKHLDDGALFARDSTIAGYNWGNQLLPIDHPGGYVFPTSGAIGPGLPLGLGVALATGKKTLLMHGDGGFMFHVGELATAAQYRIPVVIVIFNDGGYGILRGLQSRQFDGRFHGTELHTPDFVKLAESMGVPGLYADDADELGGQLEAAMSIEGPALIELNLNNMQPIEGVLRAPSR